MIRSPHHTTSFPSKKQQVTGILLMFAAGFLVHMLYDWMGAVPLLQTLLSPVLPVNESVWEHGKLALLPMLFWWSISYVVGAPNGSIGAKQWFTGGILALLTSIAWIPLLYYFYTGAFGIESVGIDIFILLVALTFGQLLGFHFLRHRPRVTLSFWLSLILLALLIGCFVLFTFDPPSLPWFTPHA